VNRHATANATRFASGPGARHSREHVSGAGVNSRRGGLAAAAAHRASLGVALAFAAVSIFAGGAASAPASDLETVTIAVIPVEPTAQAAYAHARGFFRKQGIDAKILVLGDPNAIAAAVASGDAQFAAFNIGGLAVARSRGFPVRLVAAGALYRPKSPTAALVSAPRKRITSARDLVGRTIGIDQRNTIAHVAFMTWLKRRGVRADDLTLAEHPFAQMLGPLMRGTIDAAVLPEPFLTIALLRGAKLVAPVFRSVCSTDCLLTGWVARRDVDRTLAARFRNAIQEAAVWANKKENDAASGAILARYTPIQAAVLRKMTRTRFATRLRPALAQPWIDVYAEFALIPGTFAAIDLVK
jgi:NitT/TauT family transport system substrate-binding protein